MSAATVGDAGVRGQRCVGGDSILVLGRLEVVHPECQHGAVVGAAGQIGEVTRAPGRLRFRLGVRLCSFGGIGRLRHIAGLGNLSCESPADQAEREQQSTDPHQGRLSYR